MLAQLYCIAFFKNSSCYPAGFLLTPKQRFYISKLGPKRPKLSV